MAKKLKKVERIFSEKLSPYIEGEICILLKGGKNGQKVF